MAETRAQRRAKLEARKQARAGTETSRAKGRSKTTSGAAGKSSMKMPSRDALLAFIRDNPDRATKRDIAKAFNLKGDDRIALKHFLKELEENGAFEKRGKRFAEPGALNGTTVLEIVSRDKDGGLIAKPQDWDEAAMGERPSVLVSTPHNPRAKVIIPGVGERILARVGRNGDGEYTARVIKRLERPKAATLGIVRKLKDGSWRLVPIERKESELDIQPNNLGDAQDGDLVEISTVKTGRYGLASAKVLNVIGSLSSEKAVSMIAIHAQGIPHIFPDAVLDEAEAALPPKITAPREDWRDVPLITIDPADAKDHDDAVYAQADPDNEGGFILYVAIADVAYFVRPNSHMDREALKRGNSVYFPDRVVPMLPERISNDLCSLRGGVDRPALAVKMWFDAKGEKIKHTFHRIMMMSHAKVSYQQAQAAIDGATDDDTAPIMDSILKPLWDCYACMTMGRKKRGPLELDLPERKILLKEDGTVDKVVVPARLDAHKLIEECMIQANVAAAETLEQNEQVLVYRTHDAPSLSKQESLREFLKTLDIPLAHGAALKPQAFNGILERVKGTDQADLVNSVVLRSQSQAEYTPENYGHFGLNLRRYAHFTSPIRRYADLIVHRALIKALALGDGKDALPDMEMDDLREIATSISQSERRAVQAERSTIDRLIAQHLEDCIGDTFDGRVAGMASSGLFVTLNVTGADGFVPISKLGDDYYHFHETAHAMIGEKSGLGYRLGDSVEVKVVEVQPMAGAMRFEMMSEPRDLGMGTRSFHKARRNKSANKPFGKRSKRGKR
ncbi:ribonuclease R [Ahrensia kielensis]|uniref:Ribonuclease R n=1 Tax=Ahrensia kielensis TaxID=76980 RepID=A0ABU9T4H1_9HYPH